jgi:hypothetical protein
MKSQDLQPVRVVIMLVALSWAIAACSGGEPATTEATAPVSTTAEGMSVSTLPDTSTTATPATADGGGGVATAPFSVPVGEDGITYDPEGDPPSGPSSFAVLDDGSVVIADTMAMRFGEPRLLRFDATGSPLGSTVLTDVEVASIMDVATDGRKLAVLDVYPAMERYRVLVLGESGEVETIYDIPEGFHLEDGLSGLAWDDSGVLLEIEGGASYARVASDGQFPTTRTLLIDGTPITITPGSGLSAAVEAGPASFEVTRNTDLGGTSLIGRAPDGSLLIVVDEVGLDDEGAFEVTRRVQRYSAVGELLAEQSFLIEQYADIGRTLEMTADGRVAHLVTFIDHIEIRVLNV